MIICDISFWQNDPTTPQSVDFDVMALNADGVILRAGQHTWKDRDFKQYWEASRGKLPRGSYWFYDSRVQPKRQAELWFNIMDGDFGELPMWCDFEDRYGGPYTGWKYFYDFMACLEVLVPNKELGVYTGFYYWREMTIAKAIPMASLNYFKRFPLWIAAYNTIAPKVPDPWSDWTLWQFTDNGDGTKYGVESKNIDLNYFNGTEDEFRARFGLGEMSEPTDLPPPTGEAVTVQHVDLTLTMSDQSIIKLRRTE